MGEGVYVGEHLSLHRVWKTPVGKLWSPTGLGKSVAADKAAIQRVQVPSCQLPDSGT